MAPFEDEFTRLKAGEETCKMARSLYVRALELTKPGSGRSLGQGKSALSVVCAFLASKRLGNGEITRDQACAVACVDRKTFEATMTMVESVLRPCRSSPRLGQKSITYRSLLKQYPQREDAYVPMVEVEEKLKDCGLLIDGSPIELESSLMQCAIFYWVCTVVLKVAVPDATCLRQMLKVSPKHWSATQRVLENHCSHMTEDLIRKAETALSSRTARSQMRTGTKRKVQELITRPSISSIPLTPPTSPLNDKMKRKIPGDIVSKEDESPLKRSKGPSYIPSRLGQDLSTHTPKARRVNAAASLPTPPESSITQEEGSENEAFNETIVVQSISRKRLSCRAWDLQKPTTSTIGGKSLSILDSPPVDHVAFDTSPSGSPIHSRVAQTRHHVSLAAKELCYPIQDEMPLRLRRNLHAAFLTPDVYGWKPAAHTAKKLEQARNWESLMIRKYGDPWDAW